MRARGLKRAQTYNARASGQVAPHAGAWVETVNKAGAYAAKYVAPHAGAWVETALILSISD